MKLETYDGTTCLETFLAAVRNFSMYDKGNENDGEFTWTLEHRSRLD